MDEEKVVSLVDKEPTKMQMLDQWLKELIYPGDPSDFFQEISGSGGKKEAKRKFCFYTEDYNYFITAIERENGSDYLGCGVSARKARAGEGWTRGNDLPDGEFNKKTWDRIIYSIVSYELVKLSKYQKPDSIPNGTA